MKVLIWIVAVVVLLIAGMVVFGNGDANQSSSNGAVVPSSEKVEINPNAGLYTEYTEEGLVQARGNKVLFFKASWCPTCNALDANIRKNLSEIPEDLTILEVDFDRSIDLRKKYEVTIQHTLVRVDDNGDLIKKWVGSPTLNSVVGQLIE